MTNQPTRELRSEVWYRKVHVNATLEELFVGVEKECLIRRADFTKPEAEQVEEFPLTVVIKKGTNNRSLKRYFKAGNKQKAFTEDVVFISEVVRKILTC